MNDLFLLEEFIREALLDEAKRGRKKGKKKSTAKKRAAKKGKKKASRRKTSSGGLSAATKETLKKKANKRGLTPSSVYAEYRKGLAAWATSGSRKGMSQHQWAHARVNSATPSKPWAVVKKAKSKKK
jgi:DNA invertase Pin-like site-specific DNA recombinase